MKNTEPAYLKALLPVLAFVGALGYAYAKIEGGHHKILLRGLCLALTTAPATLAVILSKRTLPVLRISIAVALMTYIIKSGRINLQAMGDCLDNWPWLLGGAILIVSQVIIGAARWLWLLRVQGINLSYWQSLRLVLVGAFFNTCLPGATGGDLFRAYAISKSVGKSPEAITTVILDRLSGLAALIFLCAIALIINIPFIKAAPQIREAAWIILGVLCFCAIFLILLMSRKLAEVLRKSSLAKWNYPGCETISRVYNALHQYHGSKGILLAAVGVSLVSHLATVAAALCFGIALNLSGLAFAQYLLLVPLGLAFNAIPITPGGIGQGQTAFYYLFAAVLPQNSSAGALGAAIMTFIHFSVYALSIIGGIVYASGYHQLHAALKLAEEAVETKKAEPLNENPA